MPVKTVRAGRELRSRCSARDQTAQQKGTLKMWVFLSTRLRRWLLMAIALPLARFLVHRLALAADRRDARSARLLHRADSAVTAVSRRTARRARH
jgi:hypothetical protein